MLMTASTGKTTQVQRPTCSRSELRKLPTTPSALTREVRHESDLRPSTRPKYVLGPRGERQINVRVDQATWDALMALKARCGDTRTVGRWYGELMAQLIHQQGRAAAGGAAAEARHRCGLCRCRRSVDRHALKRVIVQRQTEARAHQSKRPKSLSQQREQMQQRPPLKQ